MSENLQPYFKLLVISDTGIFREKVDFYGFGPVVKELEELEFFKKIIWIGFNRPDQKGNRAYMKIVDKRIEIKTLKNTGGKGIRNKLDILIQYPQYFWILYKEILKAEFIHSRAPSNPAIIAMFLSLFFPKKKFWFKYAGDWKGASSLSYKLQRKWLQNLNNNAIVTVNGIWPDQPNNIKAFENPCIDEKDRRDGKMVVCQKKLSSTINYCFVGGLNSNKGCLLLIKALLAMDLHQNLAKLHIVGEGNLRQELENLADKLKISVFFHGAISKEELVKIYEICHFIILPSQSEGFPKVIGEAMNFGCIPILSNISCIDQYIEHGRNGFLLDSIDVAGITKSLYASFKVTAEKFDAMININYQLAVKFTYQNYRDRIFSEIFR